MKTSKELIDLIDQTLTGMFGKSTSTVITLPDGKEYETDVGYIDEFWDRFKEALDLKWFE